MTILATVRLSPDTGTLKGYADVQVHFSASVLSIHGLRIVETDAVKGPWLAYPQQPAKREGKWYDIVRATGKLHDAISSAVLKEYREKQNKKSAQPAPAVPPAVIPPEVKVGDEDIPF